MRHEPVQHLRGNPFAEPGKYGFPKIKNIGHNILREIGENGTFSVKLVKMVEIKGKAL